MSLRRRLIPVATACALLVFLRVSVGHSADFDPAKLSAIRPRMQQFVDEGVAAGAVTVVGSAQGIVHHEAVGYQILETKQPLAKDALFRVASMTKPITAIGIM